MRRKLFGWTTDRTDKVLKNLVRPVRVVRWQLEPVTWLKETCGRGGAAAETEEQALTEKVVVREKRGHAVR